MAHASTRRRFLCGAVGLAGLLLAPRASRAVPPPRGLALAQLHTGETLEVVYAERGRYRSDALARLDHLLRDHRTGERHPIDPALFDLLFELREATGGGVFEVISGFRSRATNEMLRSRSGGIASRSLHLEGRAIDLRLRGVGCERLRRAAIRLARGGVGYYPASDFVHLDTGRVRSW